MDGLSSEKSTVVCQRNGHNGLSWELVLMVCHMK